MIQHSFTGAYTSQIGAQNQGIGTITSGVKDAAILGLGIAGFSGALSGPWEKGAKHALAGRVGGIGGNIMLATLQEKKASAEVREQQKQMFSSEEVGETIKAQLGDNPINRPALKKLNTVFDTLVQAKQTGILTEEGKIQSEIGDIDPNSELGKQILSKLKDDPKKEIKKKEKVEEIKQEPEKPKSFFNEEKDTIEDRVIKRSGSTYNWNETGYITPNGIRIDLSGKKEGGPAGGRYVDHRDIFELEDVNGEDFDRTTNMIEFMKRGNIRVTPETPGINVQQGKEPTKEQYDLIQNMAERLGWKNGYFAIDIDNEKGINVGSLTYETPISSRMIIEDLKEYFKSGKLPKREE